MFEIEGDEKDEQNRLRKEVLHLWKRNPVECIEELLGNPAFREHMRFAPERVKSAGIKFLMRLGVAIGGGISKYVN